MTSEGVSRTVKGEGVGACRRCKELGLGSRDQVLCILPVLQVLC